MPHNTETKLNYELPTMVESVRSGWLSTFQSAATVSGLLAAVTAQLIIFFKDKDTFGGKDHPTREPILTLTYVALILSIGATISSLILTDEFADIPIRAARSPYGQEYSKTKGNTVFVGHDWRLLRTFGLRRSAWFVVGHWLLSLLLSSVCTTLSIVIYAISQEHQRTVIIVSATAFFALFPILQFVPSRVMDGQPRGPNSVPATDSERHTLNLGDIGETLK